MSEREREGGRDGEIETERDRDRERERDRQKETEREKEKTLEDVTLALKMDEGAVSQGMQMAVRSWKRQGKGFPLEPLRELWPC